MYDIPVCLTSQHFSTMDTAYYVSCGALPHDIFPHRHDFVELELILSGQGTEIINGVEYQLKRGSLCTLLPWHIHEVMTNEEDPLEIFKCHFPLDFLLDENNPSFELSDMILQDKTLPPVISLASKDYEKIHGIFSDLKDEHENMKTWKESLIQAKIAEIIIYFDRIRRAALPSADKDGQEEQNIWKAIEFIHKSFEREITLTEVADKFHYSKTRLNESLMKYTGLHFEDLLQEIRIRNACAFLPFPLMSVSEIASLVGYKSLESFYRAFKRVKGISPGNYRKLYFNNTDRNKTTHSFINARIIYYMHLHFNEDITLSSVAQYFHYNENYLCEMLIQNGLSFVQLLHEIRIYHACALLLTTDRQINEIGFTVGFNSVETFYRVFKKLKAMSPGEYRKRQKDETPEWMEIQCL